MKKIVICTFLIAAGTAALLNINDKIETIAPEFSFKNSYAYTLGYDKSMSEKTIKAAVIDSYFRNIASNGKIIRWNKTTFPLKVYIQDSADVPEYYREVVMSAYQAWERASEGLVSFDFVENANDADMRCYFKNTDNKKSIGVHSFTISGNKITASTIVFNPEFIPSDKAYAQPLNWFHIQALLTAAFPTVFVNSVAFTKLGPFFLVDRLKIVLG